MSSLLSLLQTLDTRKPASAQEALHLESGLQELEKLLQVSDEGTITVSQMKAQAAGCNAHQLQMMSQIAHAGNQALKAGGYRSASAVNALLSSDLSFGVQPAGDHGPRGAASAVSRHSSASVKAKVKVWGLYITMSHEFVQQLTTIADTVAALLARVGVAAWICEIVAAALAATAATLKALDKGDGVWIKMTWLGIPCGMGSL